MIKEKDGEGPIKKYKFFKSKIGKVQLKIILKKKLVGK